MSAINGHTVANTPAPPDLRTEIARSVWAASSNEDDQDFDDLTDLERAGLLDFADLHVEAHVRGLIARGFKIVPPGAVMRPNTGEEAAAMIRVAQGWMAEQARKPGLVTPPRKLFVPKGSN